jgi:phytoene desaturase
VPAPLADALDADQWLALRSTVRRRVIDRQHHHGVSLDPAAIVTEEIYDPPEWARRFGLHRGSAFGAAHTLRQLGPWRSPNRHRSIRGLYYVGAGTTPGTGLPMVVLSGRMVAARIGATAADRSTVTVAG